MFLHKKKKSKANKKFAQIACRSPLFYTRPSSNINFETILSLTLNNHPFAKNRQTRPPFTYIIIIISHKCQVQTRNSSKNFQNNKAKREYVLFIWMCTQQKESWTNNVFILNKGCFWQSRFLLPSASTRNEKK
jgi:hypothetical protein